MITVNNFKKFAHDENFSSVKQLDNGKRYFNIFFDALFLYDYANEKYQKGEISQNQNRILLIFAVKQAELVRRFALSQNVELKEKEILEAFLERYYSLSIHPSFFPFVFYPS